jgi:hypothetical protein
MVVDSAARREECCYLRRGGDEYALFCVARHRDIRAYGRYACRLFLRIATPRRADLTYDYLAANRRRLGALTMLKNVKAVDILVTRISYGPGTLPVR